jgi:hypothetical protein
MPEISQAAKDAALAIAKGVLQATGECGAEARDDESAYRVAASMEPIIQGAIDLLDAERKTKLSQFGEEDRIAHRAYEAYYASISESVDGADAMPEKFDWLDHEREVAFRAAVRAAIKATLETP